VDRYQKQIAQLRDAVDAVAAGQIALCGKRAAFMDAGSPGSTLGMRKVVAGGRIELPTCGL
jgi:hypothetical protein